VNSSDLAGNNWFLLIFPEFSKLAQLNGSESGGGLFPAGSSPLPDPQLRGNPAGKERNNRMNPSIQFTPTTQILLIALLIARLTLSANAQGLNPPPDGGYPVANTAEGQNALFSLGSGGYNTALGWSSLRSNTTGSFNTGVGAGTLLFNTSNQNTATGVGALLSNTTGFRNTATGAFALLSNLGAADNTATGNAALYANTTGSGNTATGNFALAANVTGGNNTAIGNGALGNNLTGENTAVGAGALASNTTGTTNTAVGFAALTSVITASANTAIGHHALINSTGDGNTAIGVDALASNSTGQDNVAIGRSAGFSVNGSQNIAIGSVGSSGDSNTTWIGNVYASVATTRAVYVDANDKIGTLSSSRRYKEDIKPMSDASEMLFALKPVTFRYNKKIDPSHALSFGLIAEAVAEVNSDLVTLDKQGKPETVRYEAVNAMLLNEFLKEHKKVETQNCKLENQQARIQQQEATIAQLKKEIETLVAYVKQQDSKIQGVTDRIEMNQATPQLIASDQ
jgi:trimeric autotransporter adhesin